MDKKDMLWIASKYVAKGYNFEQLKYGDDLYGKEHFADDVYEYMEEMKLIGQERFYEKYKDFKLY